jgi:hypothetical protein
MIHIEQSPKDGKWYWRVEADLGEYVCEEPFDSHEDAWADMDEWFLAGARWER